MRSSRRMWSSSRLGLGVALAALISAVSPRIVAAQQPAPGAVRGDVVDTAGHPLQSARVGLPAIGALTRSDARGQFSITHVTPGRYELVASLIGRLPVGDTVVVRSGETTWVKLVLKEPPIRVETLPPRFARGTRPDTAPAETETIDHVARVARLPRLRLQPVNPSQRELRIWVGGGLGIPMVLLRVTDDGRRVRGEEIFWLKGTVPDRNTDPRWRAFMDSVPLWLRRDFQCGPVATDTTHYAGAQPGYQDQLVAACRVQFDREPDWRAVLAELERHHVWSLPDASELPHVVQRRAGEEVVSLDGVGVTVEGWNGRRYRAYTIGNPDEQPMPEFQDAWAILRLVITFRTSRSSATRN
jgi:hypothetical protein